MNALKKKFLRGRLLAQQNGICFFCFKLLEFDDATIDHLHPRALGGDDHHLNLVASCKACNQSKGDRPMTEREIKRAAKIKDVSPMYYRSICAFYSKPTVATQ